MAKKCTFGAVSRLRKKKPIFANHKKRDHKRIYDYLYYYCDYFDRRSRLILRKVTAAL